MRESLLLNTARRKLLNFKKRHGDAPVNFMEAEWLLPERFVARRPSPSNPGWEVLVKWQGQVGVDTGSVGGCLQSGVLGMVSGKTGRLALSGDGREGLSLRVRDHLVCECDRHVCHSHSFDPGWCQ
jgi:hypothetical protein